MRLGGAEVGVLPQGFIERRPSGAGIAAAKLRPRQTQHQVRIVFIQSGEHLAIGGSGFLEAVVPQQLFGVALVARDILGDLRLILQPPQLCLRVQGALYVAARLLGGPAVQQFREQFHNRIGDATGQWDENDQPDPQGVPARADDMDDEQHHENDGQGGCKQVGHSVL